MTIDPTTGRPEIILDGCNHRPKLTPEPARGDLVYCLSCRTYRAVLRARSKYKLRCANCALTRSYDRGVRLVVERLVGEHRSRFPEHSMILIDGMRVVRVYSPEGVMELRPVGSSGVQLSLPATAGDTPPY